MTEDRAISLNAVKDILKKANIEEFDIVAYRNIMQLPPVTPNEEEMTIKYIEGYNAGFCHAQAIFQKEPKTGYWILQPSNKEQGERDFIWWKCSECGQVIYSETEKDRQEHHAFCGRCGANMGDKAGKSERMKLINVDKYKKDIEHYKNTICYQRNVTMDDCMRILDKQEDILDKIRAEIINKSNEPNYLHENEDWSVGLEMALEIINKYRGE